MSEPKTFSLDGGLLLAPTQEKTMLGGEMIAYPNQPRVFRTFEGPDALRQQLKEHELMLFGLIREVVELRKRLGLPK